MMQLFRGKQPRLLVLGLDCAGPELVFDTFKDDLPNLSKLMQLGTWGKLESSVPCITVPAWSSMFSGVDPGVLGFYGFRNRLDYSYDSLSVVNGSAVNVPRIWDMLGDRQSVVVNVPQTHPPTPINGHLVSGFMTPGTSSGFTYPAILKNEVMKIAPNYQFDVHDFRQLDKAALLQQLIDLSDVQNQVVRHLLTQKPWDLFVHVNIGLDRIHHGFWRYFDPEHRAYESGYRFENAIRDYYKLIDAQIGDILELIDDDVAVLVVSDHGVKRMDGGICLNEWLWRNGWLAFKHPPPDGTITRFDDLEVDWSKTRAWGAGGYYGRMFLNVRGREPQGTIEPDKVDDVKQELSEGLSAITGPDGRILNHTIMQPEHIYQKVVNIPPDLMVYFGDLHWRSVGSLGHGSHFTLENDTGQDDANHDTYGLFIYYNPRKQGVGQVDEHTLLDITPTILDHFRLPIPDRMFGRVI